VDLDLEPLLGALRVDDLEVRAGTLNAALGDEGMWKAAVRRLAFTLIGGLNSPAF